MKYKKKSMKFPTINENGRAQILIKKGIAEFSSNVNIVAIEILVKGSGEIESLMPGNWIVKQGNKKIIIVDLNGQGTKEANFFKVNGKIEILNCFIVDVNNEIINKCQYSDKQLYSWNLSHGLNEYNVNTTNWNDMKTENIATAKAVKNKQNDETQIGSTQGGAGTITKGGY